MSKPSANRAKRGKPPQGPIRDADGLRARIDTARVPGLSGPVLDRVRRILLVLVEAQLSRGASVAAVLGDIARGAAAVQIGSTELATRQQDDAAMAACRAGCAFCCILTGEDGGTITEFEARALHGALAPLAGGLDGRAWHPRACPALDPETRTCRAYDARPMICRSYVSPDAAACESIADGIPAEGPGVLGGQLTYLATAALGRAALTGTARVPAFSLAALAAAAVEGKDAETALKAARARPGALEKELKRVARGLA